MINLITIKICVCSRVSCGRAKRRVERLKPISHKWGFQLDINWGNTTACIRHSLKWYSGMSVNWATCSLWTGCWWNLSSVKARVDAMSEFRDNEGKRLEMRMLEEREDSPDLSSPFPSKLSSQAHPAWGSTLAAGFDEVCGSPDKTVTHTNKNFLCVHGFQSESRQRCHARY